MPFFSISVLLAVNFYWVCVPYFSNRGTLAFSDIGESSRDNASQLHDVPTIGQG